VGTAQVINFSQQKRIRTALKRARAILDGAVFASAGPNDDEALAALWLVFSDANLIEAAAASPGRLAAAVRNIRGLLTQKQRARVVSRDILKALWGDSALGAPWLRRALGGPSERLKYFNSRVHKGHNEAS
jgi:hypothetical protein